MTLNIINKAVRMIKILNTIDVSKLLDEYYRLESGIQWTSSGHKGKQASIQYKDDEDPWTSGVGKSRGRELTYTNLNPYFKNTLFEELVEQYKLSRTRFMWVGPMSCYSMHIDSTPRIHVPMITNTECYFVFKTALIQHMPANQVYRTNTVLPHTFMNCSEVPRLHLVGVVAE